MTATKLPSTRSIRGQVRVPTTEAQKTRRYDAKVRRTGRVQWGRIYVHLETMKDVAMLSEAWQFKNRSELVETAIRFLAKHTRDGIERIEL